MFKIFGLNDSFFVSVRKKGSTNRYFLFFVFSFMIEATTRSSIAGDFAKTR